MVGQSALKIRRQDWHRFERSQISHRAGLLRAPFSLYRAECRWSCRPSSMSARYVGEGTMVDTWVTIGSCAQIGKNCHISGDVGIGGVLEPLQANPVIIEDNCFIGAQAGIAEGVIVEEGAVVAMGVFIGASTKIVDRDSRAKLFMGESRLIPWLCREQCRQIKVGHRLPVQ